MNREAEIFGEAVELVESERAAFVEQACGGNARLQSAVESLLRGYARAQRVFASPMVGRPNPDMPTERPGDDIGRYRLLAKIGEGGCGVVWRAEQREPVRREVALKVIKLGMDTREVIGRFEAERQLLALMDHPNIAKVHDAGSTGTGRPFFVMELVDGVPITRYCNEAQVTTPARLRLFIDVCHAIQHAHQKGIIHRDIKPSNILVARYGEAAVPKVIDFGIAKATQLGRAEGTVYTAVAQFIGTPAYMSPEQAEGNALDVDTRSDVYSLGVLLYELLTGRPPFEAPALDAGSLEELRRNIREVEPPRPSMRFRTLADATRATLAQRHGTGPAQLATQLRGDLDWIVMKAIEKNRTRRYETANGLARDLQRHLHHEPVVARPPSQAYRLQKFIRRHRIGFSAAAAIAAVLVLGVTLATWQAIRATRAEREQSRLRETAQSARRAESALRRSAEVQELAARRRAYAADMNVVQQALTDGNLGRARTLLDRQRPQPGAADLRGWEWRYLWQFCQGDARSVLAKRRAPFASVAASADGKWLAAGPSPVLLWNLQTGTGAELPVPGWVSHVAFSPSEPILAMAAVRPSPTRFQVVLWDLDTRQTVREWTFSSEADECTGLFFAEDGRTLVTSTFSPQNEIGLWRVATGEKLAGVPTGPTAGAPRYAYFAVSRDLKRAAYVSRGDAHHVQVLDLVTGRKLWRARAGTDAVTALSFSPDGTILASGEGFQESPIRLWEAASGIELGRMEGNRLFVSQLVFWPDGKTLASAGGDQTVRLWDVASRTLSRTLRGHTLEVHSLALLPDNTTLVSGSKNGELLLWDTTVAAPAARAHITIPGEVIIWRFSAESGAIITVEANGRIAERRGENYRDAKTLWQAGSRVWAADKVAREIVDSTWGSTTGSTILAGDSPRLAQVSTDGEIEIWDWERGERVGVIAAKQKGERLAPLGFAAKGEKLLLSRLAQRTQRVMREEWDIAAGRQTRFWQHDTNPRFHPLVALSPDQKHFISIASSAALMRTEVESGRETRLELDLYMVVTPGSFSWDSTLFAVPTMNGLIQVVNVDPLRHVATLSGFLLGIHSAAFSPDGRRLATGSGSGESMTLWDVGSYERLLTLRAAGSLFRQAAFSPDGNVLGALSGSRERPTLHFWRAPAWAEIESAERKESGR